MGDASLAIPHSGDVEGAMAFEDPESLAYALSKPEKNKAVPQTWENYRKERVEQVVDFTDLSAKVRRASKLEFACASDQRMVDLGLIENKRAAGLLVAVLI